MTRQAIQRTVHVGAAAFGLALLLAATPQARADGPHRGDRAESAAHRSRAVIVAPGRAAACTPSVGHGRPGTGAAPVGLCGYWKSVWVPPVYRTVHRPCGGVTRVCVRPGRYEKVWVNTPCRPGCGHDRGRLRHGRYDGRHDDGLRFHIRFNF